MTSKQKLHQKLKMLRLKDGLTFQDVIDIWKYELKDETAVTERTLRRIEQGLSTKISTLRKLATIYGCSYLKLIEGTEYEDNIIIKNNERTDSYSNGETYKADVISGYFSSYLAMEVTLAAGSKTSIEQCPNDGRKREKFVYIIEGKLTANINGEKYVLNRKDSLSFLSNVPHWFENTSKRKCVYIENKIQKYF